ncbi:efflux RND transporter periplasmic adaptor subunit [Sporomusa aerivorans]|uniref:efflux RND transporter periplasmic adaptor subunit n=1 Tax=Sporomusa aerivorans TaxID=204936 RepID=UPI00352AD9F2
MNNSQLKKFVPAILIIAVLAVVLWGVVRTSHFPAGQGLSQPSAGVTVAPVSRLSKPLEIILAGSIQSRQAVSISAPLAGRVSAVSITEGQMVNAGQSLLHIEGTPGAANAGAADNLAVQSNGETTRQAQMSYDNLVKEYERYQKLYQIGAIARRQLEETGARLQAAKDALNAAPDSFPAGSGNAARQPSSATLIAPSSGKITGLAAADGTTVQAGQQLMVLDNGGEVRAVVHLEQKDLYLIQAGTPAEIVPDSPSGQTPVAGQVEAIYPEVGTSSNNLFLTHIRTDNATGLLKPETPVTVHIKTSQMITVPAVPQAAILEEQGNKYLYLAVNNQAIRQQVTVGAAIGDFVEITSALPEEALIIITGTENLKDGSTIALQ